MEQVVVGDFNLHHPYWGGLKAQRTDPEAEEVLRLVEEYDLALLYEPGRSPSGPEIQKQQSTFH